jgi:hypothetical protein
MERITDSPLASTRVGAQAPTAAARGRLNFTPDTYRRARIVDSSAALLSNAQRRSIDDAPTIELQLAGEAT